jgi:hypothetical protein
MGRSLAIFKYLADDIGLTPSATLSVCAGFVLIAVIIMLI